MFARFVFVASALAAAAVSAAVPELVLQNAAQPGQTFPAMGLGTGGYGLNPLHTKYGAYPECWADVKSLGVHCGANTIKAVNMWLDAGGRRLDSANSYFNHQYVGQAVRESSVPREEIFFLSKIGSTNPMGYNDTLQQMDNILLETGLDYVDVTLVHWPTEKPGIANESISMDPACQNKQPTYDAKKCRINTYTALVEKWKANKTLAIGVSNYNQTHIQEIIDAGLPLPSINQCPFNPHRSSSQMELVTFCKEHNIIFLSYSPLGIPDWHAYKKAVGKPTLLEEEVVKTIATNHQKTEAQVLLNWLWTMGIPTNPRSMNLQHMQDNMNIYDFNITSEESAQLLAIPENYCSIDPSFYECAPDN